MTLGKFPRTHLAVASTLGFAVLLIAFTLPDPDADQDAQISELSAPIEAGGRARGEIPAGLAYPDTLATPGDEPQPEGVAGIDAIRNDLQAAIDLTAVEYLAVSPDTTPQKEDSRTSKVQSGDSLSVIFKREGISSQDLHQLVTSEPFGKRLRDILPGQELSFTLSPEAALTRFEYVSSPLQRLVFTREGNGFVGAEVNREPERSTTYKQGVIENSLFLASQRAGLNDTMTMRLAQIFQWDIDFVLDIRRGDEFAVLFEELYVDGEFVGHGNILAAEFVNRGRTYKAIRYTDGNGDTHYYTPDGKPMRQAFLRAPVEFSRISSNFNMNRRHPLFNRSMPHRGIDYSAPTGTPILAAGDGRIVTASRTAPNGNYLVVQHGSQVTTKYLHLSKFGPGIKQGMRVKQGQVIGYVGATGWATGPHLHYEFVVNGVHQNPRTVKLPQGEPIPRSEMARFKAEAAPLLALLNDRRQEQQIALAQ